jgi:hypothetical protein
MASFEVMARQCDQCLFSPERIVSGARAAQIIRDCARRDVSFECHKGSLAERHIACRGHFDTGVGQMSRIAERLRIVVEIDPDTLEPVG